MSYRSMRRVLVLGLSFCLLSAALPGQPPSAPPAAADQAPPKDLRPLLSPPQSEMRLVTTRYTLDRVTLAGNYLGGMRVRGGRGVGAPPAPAAPPEPLSPGRIARLERFDLDWQAALRALDRSALTPAARADLDRLEKTVQSNLAQLAADTTALSEIAPLVPFAPAIVDLVEARIRLDDVEAEKAAGTLTAVTKAVADVRARIEAGLATSGAPPDALRVPRPVALRGPAAVEQLRAALAEWFAFYNGYDPIFTWWDGLPYKQVEAALQAYSAFLKEKAAGAAEWPAAAPAAGRAAAIEPVPAPRFASVPDLKELIALPQDEMTDIVQRFRGPVRSVRGTAAGPAAPPRDRAFYQAWLKALGTLDFDRLSRNAQVDYLYLKKICELQIARAGVTLSENPPRKADASGITGKARGRQGLVFDLEDELVPYTPEELIAIADREFAWCEAEMKRASRELGLGDDWKAALEKMKGIHPPPGGQPAVIRDLMFEAVAYLRAHDLLTVPAVAAESLHMIMMTPERQLVNPFFTGGTEISVSYPTDTMEYGARLQSMRGNNTPFSHATAFHEMIPGHNLVYYVGPRLRGYRPALGGNTAFYGEGWPLYWELTLYDLGFHDTPEKRVGALFWRMHRCARIIFSMRFHLGEWSPQECVDFLVDRVGFERENAIGEVRRSFQGDYAPLYQAAYLLGGLQLRALRTEIVDSGAVPQKAFHDEILRQGSMPISLLRLVFSRQKLTRDMSIEWRF